MAAITDSEHLAEQFEKAVDWLHNKCTGYVPVDGMRYGCKVSIAYVYRVKRPGKPHVWFCVDMESSWQIKKIRRICCNQ